MDRKEEEMQFMGIADIYTEAYMIILRCSKIFKHVMFTLILPLSCFIFIAHRDISSLIFIKSDKLPDFDSVEWDLFWFFKVVYLSFLLVFYNLSTSIVVYTVSSVYKLGHEKVTLKDVRSVMPRAWKGLLVTFFCNFLLFLVYNIITTIIVTVFLAISTFGKLIQFGQGIFFLAVMVVYAAGFIYMTIIWQLANVVTVLEDLCGFQAMIKSKELIKGKLMATMFVFSQLNCSFALIQILFGKFVLFGHSIQMPQRIAFGFICFWSFCILILFGLIIQTIVYFICKSYHLEKIDEPTAIDDLAI
ncbi:hypothetical protein ACH5RR_034150 [Cinchona calisaya]|uniref:Transmembrane protein n=1 Tax=Cinchona calisaya TaxID=153742 RepID=A0ABD2YDX0_9GENT